MPYISTKQVAEKRALLKVILPEWKISVRQRDHSCICASLMEGPLEIKNADQGSISVNHFYIPSHFGDQPALCDVLVMVNEILGENCKIEYTDGDYGNIPTFYVSIEIGKWDKHYIKK